MAVAVSPMCCAIQPRQGRRKPRCQRGWLHRPDPQPFSFLHRQPSFINSVSPAITNFHNLCFLPEGSPSLPLPAGACEPLPAGSGLPLVRKSPGAQPAGAGEGIRGDEGGLGWDCGAHMNPHMIRATRFSLIARALRPVTHTGLCPTLGWDSGASHALTRAPWCPPQPAAGREDELKEG